MSLKKNILSIILVIYSTSLCGQIITGKILNGTESGTIIFSYPNWLTSKKDSARVTNKGVFTKTFNLTQPKYLTIQYGSFRKNVYVFPGARIDVTFDASNRIQFNSSFKVKNDYFINRYLDSITTNNVHYKFIYNKVNISHPIDSFRQVLKGFRTFSDSLRQAYFLNLKENKQIKPLADFLITDSINWYCYSVLSAIDYVSIIPTGNKKLFRQEEIEKKLLFQSDDTYMTSDYYKRLLFFYLKSEFEAGLNGADSTNFEKTGFTSFALEYIKLKDVTSKLEELIISQLLINILEQYTYGSAQQIEHSDSLISILKGKLTNQAFLNEFNQQYSDNRKAFLSHRVGKTAPNFILADTTGRSYTLKDFAGKILLIDVWASWCGPCIKEFPYLRALEKKFQNNNQFQLLSISTDDTKKIWIENGLLRFSPPGLGLWAGEGKEFSRDYNINLIPVLLLLDKNGNFLEFNPPRASDGNKLYQLINEKLKSK